MRCKKCGTELKNDDAFCYRCGQRTSIFQRMFSNKTFVGSLVAILIVIVAAVIFFLIWTGKIKFPDFRAGLSTEENSVSDGSVSVTPAAVSEPDLEATEAPEPTATPGVFTPVDVTAEMKPELKTMMKRLRPFLAFSSKYYENNANSFKWNNRFATVLALYNLHYVDETVKYGDAYSNIKTKVKKEMKKLFGGYVKYDLTYSDKYPDYVYRQLNDTIVYNASRITGQTYSMPMDKIIEYEEGRYRVIVSACLVSQNNPEDKGYVQKYTLFLEKEEDSGYGYYVSRIKRYQKKDSKV
ncbi:MAG: zinc ribbon domain-containing protein [Lachnospiraceae bacterium]|nr:zinc ribbon domain-containing protein [Lachnospiraceae bacterium]